MSLNARKELLEQIRTKPVSLKRRKFYDDEVKQAFIVVCKAANEICPKRLIPFVPKFVESLETHGNLAFSEHTRCRLIRLSAAPNVPKAVNID